jgi:hypothetical protein
MKKRINVFFSPNPQIDYSGLLEDIKEVVAENLSETEVHVMTEEEMKNEAVKMKKEIRTLKAQIKAGSYLDNIDKDESEGFKLASDIDNEK